MQTYPRAPVAANTERPATVGETPLAAIPTWFKGVHFRSRLEARWACVFDQFGWPWKYEPIDLAGYIPDFLLGFDTPLLVEVKAPIVENLDAARYKIDQSGWAGEALVVCEPTGDCYLGTLRERDETEWAWGAAEIFDCGKCDRTSILHAERSWQCRACGAGRGGGRQHVGGSRTSISETWTIAGNAVQWKPRGAR